MCKSLGVNLYPLKIYYQIPDSDNAKQNRLMVLLYENHKLKILLAVQPMEKIYSKENGIIFIDRLQDSAEIRYEGWSPEVEQLLKFCIGKMASDKRLNPR